MKRTDIVSSYQELKEYLLQKGFDLSRIGLEDIDHDFSVVIPKYYADLIDWYDHCDPLRLMVLPDRREKEIKTYEVVDPIGDNRFSPVPGIIHRYPDRCLLMLTNACAVHCRFCFRKSLLHEKSADLYQSLEYIREHKQIEEVIFSGGDPFVLTDHILNEVLKKIRTMSHVRMIRFHTRTPAVYPERITVELAQIVRCFSPIVVVVHINHPREITPVFKEKMLMLQKNGVMLLSQTVLMKGVNDSYDILRDLFKGLVVCGVKPYYLHHLDPAEGTHHFRISIEKGKKLMRSLRGNISGVCMPEYMIESPNGGGKIPVFLLKRESWRNYSGTTFQGERIVYVDEAVE